MGSIPIARSMNHDDSIVLRPLNHLNRAQNRDLLPGQEGCGSPKFSSAPIKARFAVVKAWLSSILSAPRARRSFLPNRKTARRVGHRYKDRGTQDLGVRGIRSFGLGSPFVAVVQAFHSHMRK